MELWQIALLLLIIIFPLDMYKKNKDKKAHKSYLDLLRQSSINQIDQMNGRQFEEYLSSLYQSLGYQTEVTKGSGDFGADLVLKNNGTKIVVQAKRYKNKVGIQSVQEVVGAKRYYDAAHTWVVTNNYFTEPARKLAHANDVLLIDRDLLIKLSAQVNREKTTTRAEKYKSN
ncbi:restriction endonuclease [Bacillus cereus]|uniref:Restriction endonuclease type IV Mrr domain-containing protein n=2 Tax=Bacillus cereus TaxID=1396 RepID=Q636Z1_BACCZ|nr:conserved hypothetical protein; possible endonuclease [Bacillus cereus E33L]QQA22663.1 restriction endonuclease [Bacillus cereus]